MELITLTQISFQPNLETISNSLHVRPNSSSENDLRRLVAEAVEIAKPKAMCRLASVEKLNEKTVLINGEQFTSKLMAVNLAEVNRAFVYVATCGRELHDWEKRQSDSLSRFYAYSINNFALRAAMTVLSDYLISRFQLKKHATMNPGSLEDWPITEQIPLFRTLGDVRNTIGVELTDGCIMVPGQSVSGVLFETEQDYVNCQLCPRENCPGRRAPFEEAKYSKIFG